MPVETRRDFLSKSPGRALGAFLCARISESPHPEIDIQILDTDLTPQFSDFLKNLVQNPPEIGGITNYHSPLDWGIGYTTRHDLTISTLKTFARLKNLETLTNAAYGTDSQIEARCMADLSDMTILQALNGNRYSGLIATRCPQDVGQEFLAFAISSPPEIEIKAIGPVLSVDCPSINHWKGEPSYLAFQRYKHMGWQHPPWNGLQWIADASSSLMRSLYPGKSGNSDNLSEGKTILLVSKQKALELMGYTTPGYRFH